jgi:hypothetical protein
MKGYLQKTEQGWVVLYDQRSLQDPSAEDGILPLYFNNDRELVMDDKQNLSFYSGKEVEFEIIKLYDDKYGHELTYAKLIRKIVQTDENGNPLTYWGGLEKPKQELHTCKYCGAETTQPDDECYAKPQQDRSCNHTNCREVCPECIHYIGYISEDCEAVKNWDRFVEQKNNELEVEKLAEISSELQEATFTIQHKTTYKHGFIDGYNKAKETIYTEEQMESCWIAAMSYRAGFSNSITYKEFIQSLKQK